MKNFKQGFTLAEVLITLGIIGVVAAMTLPTLIQKHQKKVLATKFKQSLSILTQGFQKMMADEEVTNFNDTEWIQFNCYLQSRNTTYSEGFTNIQNLRMDNPVKCEKLMQKYFKATSIDDMELLADTNNYGYIYELNDRINISHYAQLYNLSNGMLLMVGGDAKSRAMGLYDIVLDINNRNNGPNKMGRDIFMLVINSQGVVVPKFTKTYSKKQYEFYKNIYPDSYKNMSFEDYYNTLNTKIKDPHNSEMSRLGGARMYDITNFVMDY